MPDFKSMEELAKYLQGKINNALENEVAKQAKETMKEEIKEVVYQQYTPTQYERLYDGSRQTPGGVEYGLLNDESIYTGLNTDGELLIRSTRTDPYPDVEGKDIASVIEYGVGYTWEHSAIYHMQPFPRPFHELTAKRLEEEGLAKKALVDGLKSQGLNVK